MKHSRRGISKKTKPKDLERIRKPDGTKVWVANGKEYKTLRQVPDVR